MTLRLPDSILAFSMQNFEHPLELYQIIYNKICESTEYIIFCKVPDHVRVLPLLVQIENLVDYFDSISRCLIFTGTKFY